jgi:cellulose biosynthesis protein BcsQ
VTDTLINNPEQLDRLLLEGNQSSLNVQFDFIPASKSLENFSESLSTYTGNKLTILKSALRMSGLGQEYDVLLIDAPGNRNLLVQNALVATESAVVPVEAAPKGEDSLGGLREYILSQEEVLKRDGVDSNIGIRGIVPSIVEGQLPNTKKRALKLYQERRESEGLPVTPFFLWKRNILERAWQNEQTLREYIADTETRDLRQNEKDLPLRFDHLANLILTGDASQGEEDFNDFEKL